MSLSMWSFNTAFYTVLFPVTLSDQKYVVLITYMNLLVIKSSPHLHGISIQIYVAMRGSG